MPSRDAALEIRTLAQDPVPIRVSASGIWTFRGMKEHAATLAHGLAELSKQPPEKIAWDLSKVEEMDDAGALWLVHALRGAKQLQVSAAHREILEQIGTGLRVPKESARFDLLAGVVHVGESTREAGIHFRDGVIPVSYTHLTLPTKA